MRPPVVDEAVSPASPDSAAPLVATGVEVRYPAFTLGPVDVSVSMGTLVALIGANGAGKTTLLETLTGVRRPDAGEVRRFGRGVPMLGQGDLGELGYVADETEGLPDELTASELWSLHATAHARDPAHRAEMLVRADRLANELSLGRADGVIGSFSHGMRKKVQVIAALLHDPPMLVLDEPTNGLDPVSSFVIGTVLKRAADHGAGVLVATHDLAWAERFSDRVLALHAGRSSAEGPTTELLGDRGTSSLLDQFLALVEGSLDDG